MKMTLLEIVQDILSEMDSDEVNSIDDTIESQQVAGIVRNVFRQMHSNRNWPHTRKLTQFQSSTDLNKPTHMKVPEAVKETIMFQYNKQRPNETVIRMEDVTYLYPDEFLRHTNTRKQDADNVVTVKDFSGVNLLILNDQPPTYWTSFDDDYIICDSYQKDLESTLMTSKSSVLAYVTPEWVHTDDAVPDLPIDAFAALVEEAKSVAFITLKQVTNQKAETNSIKQNRWLSRKAWRAHGGVRYANFGRRSRK